VPELPEVEALAAYVRERATGRRVERIDLSAISALKTFSPPLSSASGQHVRSAGRRGKFLAIDLDSAILVTHLARAGWLHYRESLAPTLLKPGKGPIALRVHLEGGEGFDLTEAGTQKKLAVYLVTSLDQVPGIAKLGPEPLSLDEPAFAAILKAQKGQLKGVLRDQQVIAGIGNAYSDEILHAAKLSPFAISARLTDDQVSTLYQAMRSLLTDAIERSVGQRAAELKAEKRGGMRVHGRRGEACPVCGDTIREVSFADSSLQYCPTCQTGGKPLADRRLSKLLR
jgi:formamidopyrimidine-DNA glycosylase